MHTQFISYTRAQGSLPARWLGRRCLERCGRHRGSMRGRGGEGVPMQRQLHRPPLNGRQQSAVACRESAVTSSGCSSSCCVGRGEVGGSSSGSSYSCYSSRGVAALGERVVGRSTAVGGSRSRSSSSSGGRVCNMGGMGGSEGRGGGEERGRRTHGGKERGRDGAGEGIRCR